MPDAPSPNGSTGRDPSGQFAKGNSGGPGNPFAKRTAAIRSIVFDTVTEDDLREIWRWLDGLQADQILELVESGSRAKHRANRYRYLHPL